MKGLVKEFDEAHLVNIAAPASQLSELQVPVTGHSPACGTCRCDFAANKRHMSLGAAAERLVVAIVPNRAYWIPAL